MVTEAEQDLAFSGLVTGRVQGVFFRAETRRQAKSLGIRGWVRNSPDGHVEFLIEGAREALYSMRVWLAEGPSLARVDSLELEACNPQGMTDFEIRY